MKRDVAHTVAFIGIMTALMAVVLTLETYVFIYFIKPFIETSVEADPIYLVWGGALSLTALPMVFTSKTLSQALNASTFGHFLVSDAFGIPDEKLSVPIAKHGDSYSTAIFVGLVFGSVSYFFSPIYVLAAIGIFILFNVFVFCRSCWDSSSFISVNDNLSFFFS